MKFVSLKPMYFCFAKYIFIYNWGKNRENFLNNSNNIKIDNQNTFTQKHGFKKNGFTQQAQEIIKSTS